MEMLFQYARNNNDRLIIRKIRRLTVKNAHEASGETRIAFLDIYRRALLYAAAYDFDAYMLFIESDRDPDKRFYEPRRKQLREVVNALQDLEDDRLDIVSISLPPGTGKSTLGIFFISWIAGKYPNQPNLMSAHSGILTRSFYDGVLQIITDPEYLWREVFPDITVQATNSKEETINLDQRQRFKTITCRAINASLTGATRCEKYLYADDLVSGIEEAMSIDRLNKLWEAYTNDLKSRKKLGCKEIHIATRWSVHDPIGRLQRMHIDNPRARFVVIPALNENGESNFNYKFGVGFDKSYFEDMRRSLDTASFNALFQNQPIEREGLLYDAKELRRYFELPKDTEPDAIVAICDTKDTGKDYAFLPIAYAYGDDYYIEACICDCSTHYEPRVVKALMEHKVQKARFECNSAGGRIAKEIQAEVKKLGGITQITTKYTTKNKETKIIVNEPFVKDHFLFKDADLYAPNSDYGKMMEFLTTYTTAGKNKFDDVPDGMAMLAEFVKNLSGNSLKIFDRFF